MKSLKRVLALAVVFVMVLGSIPAMAATFTDVAEADQEAVSVLTQLNIIQGYNEDGQMLFKGDQTITRAEFAAVVDRMIGMEDVAKAQTSTIFSDVTSSDWASGYVTTAVNQGIIVGMGDGTFEPESPVTYEQAVKMIVCALGYDSRANDEGGYPTGYLFVAQTIGLLDGVAGRVGENATRSIVAQLCYNALDIPLMQKIVYGSSSKLTGVYDGTEFSPRKTLMSEYLNVVKLAGTVTDNENSSGNSLKEGIVTIDITDNYDSKYADTFDKYEVGATTDFNVGQTDAKDYIGHNVVIFVKHESNRSLDPTIISIADNTSTNKKLTVALEDLKSAEVKGDNVLVEYYTDKDNGKTNKIYIPDGDIAAFINGIKQDGYDADEFLANLDGGDNYIDQSGTIQFVSTTNEGTADYDSIFITVYQNFLVDSVDENSQKIFASTDSPYGSDLSFDPDDKDVKTTIVDEDGNIVDPKDLKQNDVLSIKSNFPFASASSVDKEIYDCTLIRKTVEGTVTETSQDDPVKYYIDGTEYKVDPDADLSLDNGDQGTFYLDVLGRIVAYTLGDDKTGTSNYAIFVNAVANDFNGYRVKLYTADGNMIIKDLATKVKWADGVTTSTKDDQDVPAVTDLNDYVGKICTYKENGSSQISSLIFSTEDTTAAVNGYIAPNDTADKKNVLQTNINDAATSQLLVENSDQPRIKANTANGTKTVYLADDAKIIVAYSGGNWTTAADSNFDIWNVKNITDDQDLSIPVSVYDIDSDNNEAQLVFINGSATVINATTGIALVRSLSNATNTEGDDVTKFRIVSNTNDTVVDEKANVKEFTLAEDNTVNGPDAEKGSIVMADSRNTLNEVKTLSVLTTMGADGKFEATDYLVDVKADSNSDVEYYFGDVTNKKSSTITFNDVVSGNDDQTIKISTSTKVMIYDERRTGSSMVYEGSISDVQYDKNGNISDDDVDSYSIFVREYKGNVDDVVIYIYAN